MRGPGRTRAGTAVQPWGEALDPSSRPASRRARHCSPLSAPGWGRPHRPCGGSPRVSVSQTPQHWVWGASRPPPSRPSHRPSWRPPGARPLSALAETKPLRPHSQALHRQPQPHPGPRAPAAAPGPPIIVRRATENSARCAAGRPRVQTPAPRGGQGPALPAQGAGSGRDDDGLFRQDRRTGSGSPSPQHAFPGQPPQVTSPHGRLPATPQVSELRTSQLREPAK